MVDSVHNLPYYEHKLTLFRMCYGFCKFIININTGSKTKYLTSYCVGLKYDVVNLQYFSLFSVLVKYKLSPASDRISNINVIHTYTMFLLLIIFFSFTSDILVHDIIWDDYIL